MAINTLLRLLLKYHMSQSIYCPVIFLYRCLSFHILIQIFEYDFSEGKAKETKRKMIATIRKFKDIKKYLINQNSQLSHGLSDIAAHLQAELQDDLYHFQIITEDQVISALYQKEERGILCVQVYQELQKIGNKTTLVTVMKGLLTPNEHKDVEELSLAEAEEELRIFLKDVEFGSQAVRRGSITASVVNKYEGVVMRVIKDNLGEFQAAKTMMEEIQDKTGTG